MRKLWRQKPNPNGCAEVKFFRSSGLRINSSVSSWVHIEFDPGWLSKWVIRFTFRDNVMIPYMTSKSPLIFVLSAIIMLYLKYNLEAIKLLLFHKEYLLSFHYLHIFYWKTTMPDKTNHISDNKLIWKKSLYLILDMSCNFLIEWKKCSSQDLSQ